MAVGDSLKIAGLQDVTVVQAIGGAIARNPASPSQCASTIASAINATCVNISAPAVASSVEARAIMVAEPLVAEQMSILLRANKALFGIASLRPNASLYSEGVFEAAELQSYIDGDAVGVLAARFIDAWGQPVAGALDDRVIGLSLEELLRVDLRICVAGGFDKVPAILAALRRGYANVLVTDAATARGVLRADGGVELDRRPNDKQIVRERRREPRQFVKKFINEPDVVVEEMLDGAIRAHRAFIRPLASRGARWWRWTGRAQARSVLWSAAVRGTSLVSSATSARASPTPSRSATSSRRPRPIRSSNARKPFPVAPAFCSSTVTMWATS